MNKLILKVMNPQYNGTVLYINDEIVKPEKDKQGHETYICETANPTVDIKLYKYLEVNNPAYFLWQILFYLISIFGLFDKRPDKGCTILKYHSTITLDGSTDVIMRISKSKKDVTAAQLECSTSVVEHENVRMTDKKAKKKLKGLKITKFFLFIAFVVGLALLATALL